MNPTTDDQYVFFRGGNGDIYEDDYNYAAGTWGGKDMCTAHSWGCNVASGPGVAVADDNSQYVFFEGGNGDIYEDAYTNGSWSGQDMCASHSWGCNVGSGPGAAVNPTTDDQYVFFRGGNGDIYEDHYNYAAGTWGGAGHVHQPQLGLQRCFRTRRRGCR